MTITTVGELRSFIKDLPDEMRLLPHVGPTLEDVVLDAANNSIDDATAEVFIDIIDDTLSIMIDAELSNEEDEES